MADLAFTASSGAATALVSATAKTILQVKAPANQRVVVKGFRVMGASAAGGTDAAVKARFTRSTANFGTGSSVTLQKVDPDDQVSIQSTAYSSFSAEPTSPTDASDYLYFNPEAGYAEMWPREQWRKIPGGASLQLEMTSVSGTPSVTATFFCEE